MTRMQFRHAVQWIAEKDFGTRSRLRGQQEDDQFAASKRALAN